MGTLHRCPMCNMSYVSYASDFKCPRPSCGADQRVAVRLAQAVGKVIWDQATKGDDDKKKKK